MANIERCEVYPEWGGFQFSRTNKLSLQNCVGHVMSRSRVGLSMSFQDTEGMLSLVSTYLDNKILSSLLKQEGTNTTGPLPPIPGVVPRTFCPPPPEFLQTLSSEVMGHAADEINFIW